MKESLTEREILFPPPPVHSTLPFLQLPSKRNECHEQQTCLLTEHFRQETPPPMVNRDGKKVAGKPDLSEVRKGDEKKNGVNMS